MSTPAGIGQVSQPNKLSSSAVKDISSKDMPNLAKAFAPVTYRKSRRSRRSRRSRYSPYPGSNPGLAQQLIQECLGEPLDIPPPIVPLTESKMELENKTVVSNGWSPSDFNDDIPLSQLAEEITPGSVNGEEESGGDDDDDISSDLAKADHDECMIALQTLTIDDVKSWHERAIYSRNGHNRVGTMYRIVTASCDVPLSVRNGRVVRGGDNVYVGPVYYGPGPRSPHVQFADPNLGSE